MHRPPKWWLCTPLVPHVAYIPVMTPDQELDALKNWPDEEVCKLLASRMRQLRQDSGHTQETLAALANVSLRTFKRFEAEGKANLETFIRILRALNRAQYLHLIFPANRAGSAYEEKIAKARTRWQRPSHS